MAQHCVCCMLRPYSDYDEWQQMAAYLKKKHPLSAKNFEKM